MSRNLWMSAVPQPALWIQNLRSKFGLGLAEFVSCVPHKFRKTNELCWKSCALDWKWYTSFHSAEKKFQWACGWLVKVFHTDGKIQLRAYKCSCDFRWIDAVRRRKPSNGWTAEPRRLWVDIGNEASVMGWRHRVHTEGSSRDVQMLQVYKNCVTENASNSICSP